MGAGVEDGGCEGATGGADACRDPVVEDRAVEWRKDAVECPADLVGGLVEGVAGDATDTRFSVEPTR